MLLIDSNDILFNWLILIKYVSSLYWSIPLPLPKSKEAELFAKSYHRIFSRIGETTTVLSHLVEIPSPHHKAKKNKGNFPFLFLLVLNGKRIQNLQWKLQNHLQYQPWVLCVCDLAKYKVRTFLSFSYPGPPLTF